MKFLKTTSFRFLIYINEKFLIFLLYFSIRIFQYLERYTFRIKRISIILSLTCELHGCKNSWIEGEENRISQFVERHATTTQNRLLLRVISMQMRRASKAHDGRPLGKMKKER